MIKMALPNKGQLFEPTIELLKECGYKAKKSRKSLTCIDIENDIEFYFLRPYDIPMYVAEGIIDLGITGIDFNEERCGKATKVMDLHFGHSKLCAAVPNDSDYKDIMDLKGARIATSFPNTTRNFFNAPDMQITELEGAVEISVKLGISDAVVDIVETGSTLKQAGLRLLGEPMSFSNAAIYAHPGRETSPEMLKLQKRIKGKLVALDHVMVEYDTPKEILDTVCAITPGIESPTVMPLHDPEWYSVKSMIKKSESNVIMDKLSELGCKGVIITAIESARI
ncbi:MAG: ATP phosphoribosyltransferase [Fibrobacterales bacterium]